MSSRNKADVSKDSRFFLVSSDKVIEFAGKSRASAHAGGDFALSWCSPILSADIDREFEIKETPTTMVCSAACVGERRRGGAFLGNACGCGRVCGSGYWHKMCGGGCGSRDGRL